MDERLVNSLVELAADLPASDLTRLSAVLEGIASAHSAGTERLRDAVPVRSFEEKASRLVGHWRQSAPDVSGATLALALYAAAKAGEQRGKGLSAELVWTGPSSPSMPFRRTDRVLLELIESSITELWIVAFAVYQVPDIGDAIARAAGRQVKVRMLVETEADSEGRLSKDCLDQIGKSWGKQVDFYTWPLENRPEDENRRRGVLHAKFAVSDRRHLLITSANLTAAALCLNIEFGVLLHGELLAAPISFHLEAMKHKELIRRYS